jgi:hypothetical protein
MRYRSHKTGQEGVKQAMLDHRKSCYKIASFSLKQIEQDKVS